MVSHAKPNGCFTARLRVAATSDVVGLQGRVRDGIQRITADGKTGR